MAVERNLPLVCSVVKKFLNRGYEYEDLYQIGSIGLVKSINRFSENYDTAFSTYAVPMIIGEIKRFIRDDGMIKVSRNLKELGQKLYFAKRELKNKLNRDPTNEELADYNNMTLEEVEKVLLANSEPKYLSSVVHEGERNNITLQDKLENNEELEKKLLDKIVIEDALHHLNEESRNVITLRYVEDKTQVEVAKKLNISQVQVSRLEKKALKKLKEIMEGNVVTKKDEAFKMFAEGIEPMGVAEKLGLTRSTVYTYKTEYNNRNKAIKNVRKDSIKHPVVKETNNKIEAKEIDKKEEVRLLRPVLLQGEVMQYRILESGRIEVVSAENSIQFNKEKIDIFIQELMELSKAI